MANTPMVPMVWNLADCVVITHSNSKFVLHANGESYIEGPIGNVAIGLVKYIVEREYAPGLIAIELNKSLRIDIDKNFTLEWIGNDKPMFIDDLSKEFERVIRMKAFW